MLSLLYIPRCVQGNWCLPWGVKIGLLLPVWWQCINCVLIDCADMMEFWIVKLSMLRGGHTQKATETELKREIQIVSILAHLYTPGRACWFWKATQIAVGTPIL